MRNKFFNADKETLLDRYAESGKETGRKLARSQTKSFTNLKSKDSKNGFTDGAAAAYDSKLEGSLGEIGIYSWVI